MSVFDAVDIFFVLGENGGLKRDKLVIHIVYDGTQNVIQVP